jgi:hypothetical protein
MEEGGIDPRVLAHLRRLVENRRTLWVVDSQGLELEAIADAVEEDRRRLRLSIPSLPVHALIRPEPLTLALAAGGERWQGASRFQVRIDRTTVAVEIPITMAPARRRAAPRIALDPNEPVRGLLRLGRRGPVLTGPLEDLSPGGFCMRVERAMDLDSQRRLDPRHLGLERGQAIDTVELTGLAADPFEAAGFLRELDTDPGGVMRLHVQLRGVLRADRSFLVDWTATRASPPTERLPEPD